MEIFNQHIWGEILARLSYDDVENMRYALYLDCTGFQKTFGHTKLWKMLFRQTVDKYIFNVPDKVNMSWYTATEILVNSKITFSVYCYTCGRDYHRESIGLPINCRICGNKVKHEFNIHH